MVRLGHDCGSEFISPGSKFDPCVDKENRIRKPETDPTFEDKKPMPDLILRKHPESELNLFLKTDPEQDPTNAPGKTEGSRSETLA